MKNPFYYGVCDGGSYFKYFETFPLFLCAKFIEMEKFETAGEKKEFWRKM